VVTRAVVVMVSTLVCALPVRLGIGLVVHEVVVAAGKPEAAEREILSGKLLSVPVT
jgi:hypothetical protein